MASASATTATIIQTDRVSNAAAATPTTACRALEAHLDAKQAMPSITLLIVDSTGMWITARQAHSGTVPPVRSGPAEAHARPGSSLMELYALPNSPMFVAKETTTTAYHVSRLRTHPCV